MINQFLVYNITLCLHECFSLSLSYLLGSCVYINLISGPPTVVFVSLCYSGHLSQTHLALQYIAFVNIIQTTPLVLHDG